MDFEIRKDRKPQGRRALVREQEEYFRLMDQGFSTREAAQLVDADYSRMLNQSQQFHLIGPSATPDLPMRIGVDM
ncbi:hypothetical protein MBA17_32965 [Streptosporangium sp. KLBMP 9127]|nr:hypothetical protein [Streptosporangium sp. KLBMP 9127]